MRTTYMIALCLLAASATTTLAQEQTTETETMAEEVMEDAVEEMADDVMADDAMEEAMADEPMTKEVMSEDTMSEDMADDAMEAEMADETMDAEMVEDAMADEVMAEETMSEETMADDVMEDETPTLEEVAAADPDLAVRTNDDGEVDAMVMLSDVLFGFGDASLNPAALDVLAGVAEKLSGVPSLEITGHTDSVGDEAFNLDLGQRRADAVRDWLIANTSFEADVITARGVGEADPIAENRTEAGGDNPEGRALNRRVEFTLPDEG